MATSRDPSPIPPSEGDTIDDQMDDTHLPGTDLENDDQSNVENLEQTPTVKGSRRGKGLGSTSKKSKPRKSAAMWISEGPAEGTEDEGSVLSVSQSRGKIKGEETPDGDKTLGTAVGTRRQANGTVGSVYSGSKIRHIKKVDGTPLWRKEIQYEFLRLVVEDTKPVFTRVSDGKKGCNFADIYIDCMARSSKTSKILKDRLQIDRQAAQNMAMICLLVNVGRMNTTLNFFPEMRAQLRTYHSIPSLQAYKSQRDYKSLQDAPRLKSILKGASEDEEQPRVMAQVRQKPVPRTNPVNLIFVISQFAPKISELHFTDKVDFFDLTMRSTISSASRARAFLWLMWWYLESDFSKEAALNNPFGPGEYADGQDPEDPKAVPELVPKLVFISEEEGDAENVDPEEEKEFAEKMSKERKRIMAGMPSEYGSAEPGNADHKVVKRLKKSAATFGDDDSIISDVDSRASPGAGRSPAPDTFAQGGHVVSSLGGPTDSLDEEWEAVDPHPGRGRYKRVRGKNTPSRTKGTGRTSEGGRNLLKSRAAGTPEYRSTPQPLQPGIGNHPVISQYGAHRSRNDVDSVKGAGNDGGASKPRARTGYQRELEEHRNKRIDWALRRRRRDVLKEAKETRERGRWLLRAARRISELSPTYDSEEDDDRNGVMGVGSYGLGGLLGKRWTGSGDEDNAIPPGYEPDDFGEEAETWLKVMRRTKSRLEVWSGDRDMAIYNARVHGIKPPLDPIDNFTAIPPGPSRAKLNGATTNTSRKSTALEPSRGSGRRGGRKSRGGGNAGTSDRRAGTRRRSASNMDLDDQITQDLLAERSEDEMMVDQEDGDVDSGDNDGDGDGDHDADIEGDADGDGEDVDGDGDGNSDVDMD